MKKFMLFVVACSSVSAAACKDEGSDSWESLEEYEGRGSEDCQAWQYSLCEFMSEKCGVSTSDRTQCETQYGSMACLSDAAAAACAETFQSAETCDTAVFSACDWDVIADPQPAIDGCDALNKAACERMIECGSTLTMDSCMEEMEADLDCTVAIGLKDSYEACMSSIAEMSCTETSSDACTHVILTSE